MTALEHLSSLVGEEYTNHKIYHSVQVVFLTVILRVKQVVKRMMKLEICSYQHNLDDDSGEWVAYWQVCFPLLQNVHL